MASNYTENYQLPLWAADDAFLRTEFNDAHEKIEDALTEMAAKIPRIAAGSYKGTGEYGVGVSKTLEFGFAAQLVLIMRDDGNSQLSGLFLRPCTTGLGGFDNNSSPGLTWTDTGVTWTAGDTYYADGLLNAKNKTYRWWAIG